MKQAFDLVEGCIVGSSTIEVGYLFGNEKIVFVKAGLGGTYLGYDNKYLKIAQLLNDRYGCSVICASNPNDKNCGIDADRKTLLNYISKNKIAKPELYFFGHSNGCVKGLELASTKVCFRKMILVNMPLMINFHKTLKLISNIPDTNILAVYGETDPSTPYISFLEGKHSNISILRVPDADHNFKGKLDEFIGISEYLMK